MDIRSPQGKNNGSSGLTKMEDIQAKRNTHSMEPMSPNNDAYNVLPDCCKENLDILIVGINPGYHSAITKHHYAGPTNHFWKC